MAQPVGDFLAALPIWFLAIAAGTLGAIWGSFVAALCSRWPKGQSITSGRSRCDHCGKTISARDLVPILSFLLLRGRCRQCRERLGIEMIGTELLCAAIGALSFLLLPAQQALALAIFGWLLVPLATLDFRHLWLPDRLIALLAVAGLLLAPLLDSAVTTIDRLIGAATGFAALELVRRAYRAVRHGEGMGAGDPKLFGALGLWLGWPMLPATLLLASGIGLTFALARLGKQDRMQAGLPFGAYLSVAAFAGACYVVNSGLG